ncbi:hypothetical protein GCM10009565_09080 [Amycolatopsis albidoflavus]
MDLSDSAREIRGNGAFGRGDTGARATVGKQVMIAPRSTDERGAVNRRTANWPPRRLARDTQVA